LLSLSSSMSSLSSWNKVFSFRIFLRMTTLWLSLACLSETVGSKGEVIEMTVEGVWEYLAWDYMGKVD
jgi:hypothetical protein